MSMENRKLTYDKLVRLKRYDAISAALREEFGDPEPKPAPTAAPAKKAEPKPKSGGK